jgi:orotate phosphoribosyltransferase
VLIDAEALRFGDLITKSGRPTPYFVNFGQVRTGPQLAALAECYADGIERIFGDGVDVLFGPAYKGIPLAVATALALQRRGTPVGFAFDRKEAKDHGEGGTIVGMQPRDGDRIVILEDVTTAGTSLRESMPLLRGRRRSTWSECSSVSTGSSTRTTRRRRRSTGSGGCSACASRPSRRSRTSRPACTVEPSGTTISRASAAISIATGPVGADRPAISRATRRWPRPRPPGRARG